MPKLTAKSLSFTHNGGDSKNNAPASRRLSRIYNADQLAIIVTNRRARLGLKPTKISRFEN